MKKSIFVLFAFFIFCSISIAQSKQSYNYQAQKKLIPADLGKVYLGMPFDQFAKLHDLKNAEVGDTRFEWLELKLPISGGSVERLTVRIHGLSMDDKKGILKDEVLKIKEDDGFIYEKKVIKLSVNEIPAKGFVYAMYLNFKTDFDQKNFVLKTYGKKGEVRDPNDPYHFFDIQWEKKTSDGLIWLIRSFHEDDKRILQLLGRIAGTEWDVD